MKNKEIADVFTRMGTLLEIQGENVFKVKAYYKAAENLEGLVEDIETLKKEERLSEIPGIGQALKEKIEEYLNKGEISAYKKLTQEIPESLLEIVNIPTIGPKKAKLFYEQLKIKTLDELNAAASAGKLLGLPGIKEKTVLNILQGLKVVREGQERMTIARATETAEEFIAALKKIKAVKQISTAGSLRRGCETIRDIDLLIDSTDPKKVMDAFVSLPQVKSINAHGETKSSILTHDNIQLDVRVVEPQCFGATLLYFTGSKSFNIKLRQIAIEKDMKVNEYGIFSVKNNKERLLASKTEEECFKALDLPYVPPELREEMGEEELLTTRKIPQLITQDDIRGELHVHSKYSDGNHTIARMAEAARKRGYRYLAVSDHSERLKVAGGVSPENLKKKKKEIDELNKGYRNFRILFGSEVEIDTEGNLDYNERILSEFDVVIAAIHSGFEQSKEQLTRRLVRACQNKHTNIIAHPTGVHLGKREPYDIDFKEVCKAAADNNVFLEINSFPIRIDLNTSNVYFARSLGVKFVIDTDAHHLDHLEYMKYGVTIARRGWLTKEDVINTRELKELLKVLEK